MKKLFALILAVTLMLSLAACGKEEPAATGATTAPAVTQPTYQEIANPVTYFSMNYTRNSEPPRVLVAFANEDGTVSMDYTGETRKVGDFNSTLFHGIAAELEKTDLAGLNGKDVLEEGEDHGSMHIEYADGTMLTVTYNGAVSEAFIKGFEIMDAFFAKTTKDLSVYVPNPMILGDVGQRQLNVVTAILDGAGLQNLDSYTITALEKGEGFAYAAGLTGDTGIASAVSFAPMMNTTAYSMVIVTLEEGADADAVCKDFEENIDWGKWVCVRPTNALIATKDNMVLCLVAADDLFVQTEAGIGTAGWTTVKALENK